MHGLPVFQGVAYPYISVRVAEKQDNMTTDGGAHLSYNTINEDLRSKKTKKALYTAMFSLLKKYNFRKISIKGICEEAYISRATFYTHFIDKYDLLEHWVTELWPKNEYKGNAFAQMEEEINGNKQETGLILKNLVYDADDETYDILFAFIVSTLNLDMDMAKGHGNETYTKNIIVANFYAGGILSYLKWQVKNKFPSEIPLMNRYLYDMIHVLSDCQLG